jgi:hypothetical protein
VTSRAVLVLALAGTCSAPPVVHTAANTPVRSSALRPWPQGVPTDGTHWVIESTPSGAAIWCDGVDTGARTPTTFAPPPPGKHVVKLTLDGYADDKTELNQVAGTGLSLGRGLRPRADVEREEASQRAAHRPVDEAAREATRSFLGSDLTHAEVKLERGPNISFPPVTVMIRGDGSGKVTWMPMPDMHEHSVTLRASPEDVRGIFDALVAQGFADVVGAERMPVPDEFKVRIEVTSASGAAVSAEKWWNDEHARFDPVVNAVLRVVATLPMDVRRQFRL